MVAAENQNMEFKREYAAEIRKEVVAFANSDGGSIFVGVEDNGFVCGLADSDKVANQLSNSLKDAIAPDVMPFVEIEKIEIDGKQVVKVGVSPGVNRPYYIREKGLKPSGVYVRKGSSSQPVTDEGIRQMILQNSQCSYEECRSMKQELTFDALNKALATREIEFGEAQMKTLKLFGADGLYTNLALLLSDQCPVTTKTALYQGRENIVFRDRQEFGGSIIKQMDEVYHYIDLCNKTKATFTGLNRIDARDYPEEAVREAWLNCLVHRDYSFSGSTIINIYDDRIEFVSLGGLVPGLELESIFLGVSQSRNPNLAALFYRMRLIESYGTGIGKINRGYRQKKKAPKFETAAGVFRVTLPNNNEEERTAGSVPVPKPEKKPEKDEKAVVMEYVLEHGSITRQQAEMLIQAGSTKAFKILKALCAEDKLSAEGHGRQVRYVRGLRCQV